MRVYVIGAGAMGSIYGARLSKCADVTLIDTNSNVVDKINKDGIILEENGVETNYKVKARTSFSGMDKADLIILFTKSIYSEAALDSAKEAIGDDTYLMTLQNGAGHETLLEKYQKRDHIIIGTTEDNGALLELGKIHHGGKGGTNIGLLEGDTETLKPFKALFDNAGFILRIKENINQIIWDKLMINISISALTAVLQSDMSYIAENDDVFDFAKKLVHEAIMVGQKMGLVFDEEKIIENVRSTSLNNKGGYTSIMMDIKNGRRTEVNTISGAVLSKAKELGINVPYNETIVFLIHQAEKKKKIF